MVVNGEAHYYLANMTGCINCGYGSFCSFVELLQEFGSPVTPLTNPVFSFSGREEFDVSQGYLQPSIYFPRPLPGLPELHVFQLPSDNHEVMSPHMAGNGRKPS